MNTGRLFLPEKEGSKMENIIWTDRKRTLFGLPLSFTVYELNNEKLIIKTGLLHLKEHEVRLYRILDVTLTKTLGQRMFGIGTIHCCSADKTMGDFDIQGIKNSKEIKEMLSDMVEKQRVEKGVTSREFFEDNAH